MFKPAVKLFQLGLSFCVILSGHAFAASIPGVVSGKTGPPGGGIHAVDAAAWGAERNRASIDSFPLTSGVEISDMHVRRQTTEAGESYNRLFFMVKGLNNAYLTGDEGFSGVHLYAPDGQEASLSSPTFSSLNILQWADGSGLLGLSLADLYEPVSVFEAYISESLTPGAYRLEFAYDDQTYEKEFQFNEQVTLPVVSSSSFLLSEDANGDVAWSWEPPGDLCSDASGQTASVRTSISAIIDIYEDDQLTRQLLIPVSTCSGAYTLTAWFVQALNSMGDEFHLTIILQTDDNNNRSYSNELILQTIGDYTPPETPVGGEGQIVDEVTGLGVPGAKLLFIPGWLQIIADDNGEFTTSDIPPGNYSVRISATSYQTKILSDVTISADGTNYPGATLTPMAVTAAAVEGRIVDAVTGRGAPDGRIDFSPGAYSITANAGGWFASYDIPPGNYDVKISAEGYTEKNFSGVVILPGMNSYPRIRMEPSSAPKVVKAVAGLDVVPNDGSISVLLTADVGHPDGTDQIKSVVVDLSDFGGSANQAMSENTNNDDVVSEYKTYSYQATPASTTSIRSHYLKVTATDYRGFTGVGYIDLSVRARLLGSIQPTQSDSQNVINPLDSQTLTITFTTNPSGAKKESGRTGDDCHVELTIYTPGGEVYDVYQVYDSEDIIIEGAEAGTWRFETVNKCDAPVNYEIETQGGGTGMIFGQVVDAFSGLGVSGANVSSDTGGGTQSLTDGYFNGPVVAGVGAVTTIASDYLVHIKAGEVFVAGESTNLTIQIIPENAAAQPPPTTGNVSAVLDPSEEPDPLSQPFAAKTSDGFLTLDALFPAYQQAMNLYLALVVDYPGVSDIIFLFDSNNAITDLSQGLTAWRAGATTEQYSRVLPPVPLNLLPPAVYTFASMAAPSSGTPAGSDLIYYSITLGQAPPAGPVVTHAPSPLEAPDPVGQPLAAKITGGNLVLDVWFPPQQEASTLYVCYLTPGPAGAIRMIDSSDEWATLSDALTPWRKEVKTKQAKTVLTKPVSEMAPGDYTFYSIITTDPDQFSNYNMVYFTKTIGE